MTMSPEDLNRLAELEAAATTADVEEVDVERYLTVIRADWERDGVSHRERYGSLRAGIILALHVAAIAEAHAGCGAILRCETCSAIRPAVAYALAAARLQREVDR